MARRSAGVEKEVKAGMDEVYEVEVWEVEFKEFKDARMWRK
jgi:hypothetical protein